ncbi:MULTISPECIES: hypothetical protein [Tenacibaculum]|uniref:hypothetical protein n=1 Tax=Tenacibaculum TaxID=104267 RepID=UPI0014316C7A|nr:hypothetical protein [Tenacibaculum mesophilum]KAF9657665.1 hypothetical protein HBA12_10550 [Tenacibaculum mesophilum]
MNLRDPDEVTNNILTFLREQSKNAERQFKTSRNLIIATIAIMILQIFITGFSISISNSEQNNLTEIIDTQSKQSEVISRMSLSLLDLGNQVRTLKQENARLNQKLSK